MHRLSGKQSVILFPYPCQRVFAKKSLEIREECLLRALPPPHLTSSDRDILRDTRGLLASIFSKMAEVCAGFLHGIVRFLYWWVFHASVFFSPMGRCSLLTSYCSRAIALFSALYTSSRLLTLISVHCFRAFVFVTPSGASEASVRRRWLP